MTRSRSRKHLRPVLFTAFVAVLLGVLGAWIAREEHYLRSGREIVLQSRPVDPIDPLRGQYLTIAYVAQDLSLAGRFCSDANGDGWIYVTLDRQGQYWVPVDCDDSPRSRSALGGEAVIMKARLQGAGPERQTVSYPDTDRYYVPDGTPAPPKTPDVVLSVTGDGTARIKRLEIDGASWP